MNADDPIKRETQLFAWMLLLNDLTFTAYTELAPERQVAIAHVHGLNAEGLAIALEQVTTVIRARLDQFKRVEEDQRRGAH